MHARGAPDHHPSSSRAGYAPLNAPHAPLPDEGAAERIAQRVCTPRGVMIAALCAGAFYFGERRPARPPRGLGRGARGWGGNAGLAMARASSSPEVGGWRAGTRREPRACPRASSIVTGCASTTTTTRRGPRAPRESVTGGGRRRRRRTTTFWIGSAPPGARGPGATFRGAREVPDAARGTTRTGADPFRRRGFDCRRGRRRPGEGGGETRDENHRLAARVDGKEDTAGGDAAGGGFDELELAHPRHRVPTVRRVIASSSSLDFLISVALPRDD